MTSAVIKWLTGLGSKWGHSDFPGEREIRSVFTLTHYQHESSCLGFILQHRKTAFAQLYLWRTTISGSKCSVIAKANNVLYTVLTVCFKTIFLRSLFWVGIGPFWRNTFLYQKITILLFIHISKSQMAIQSFLLIIEYKWLKYCFQGCCEPRDVVLIEFIKAVLKLNILEDSAIFYSPSCQQQPQRWYPMTCVDPYQHCSKYFFCVLPNYTKLYRYEMTIEWVNDDKIHICGWITSNVWCE